MKANESRKTLLQDSEEKLKIQPSPSPPDLKEFSNLECKKPSLSWVS